MSDHSPGRIDDAEPLYRLILPDYLESSLLSVDPVAFRAAEALGLSVIRARHVSRADMRERVLAYAKRRNVSPPDVLLTMARCGDVRAIELSGARGYRIYDTATEHDPAHADVCRALVFPSGTPNQRVHFKGLSRSLSGVFTVVRGVLD